MSDTVPGKREEWLVVDTERRLLGFFDNDPENDGEQQPIQKDTLVHMIGNLRFRMEQLEAIAFPLHVVRVDMEEAERRVVGTITGRSDASPSADTAPSAVAPVAGVAVPPESAVAVDVARERSERSEWPATFYLRAHNDFHEEQLCDLLHLFVYGHSAVSDVTLHRMVAELAIMRAIGT